MHSFQTAILKPQEINDLLSLQEENLLQNLKEAEAADQGFLTFQYTPESISDMMQDMPQPVAWSGKIMTGYALATSCRAGMDMELLRPLVELSNTLDFKGKPLAGQKYYLLGQICVKEQWRGKGLFKALYEKHRALFSETHDCVVTEIAVSNKHSLAAHGKIGFKTLHEYSDGRQQWYVVAWDWK